MEAIQMDVNDKRKHKEWEASQLNYFEGNNDIHHIPDLFLFAFAQN